MVSIDSSIPQAHVCSLARARTVLKELGNLRACQKDSDPPQSETLKLPKTSSRRRLTSLSDHAIEPAEFTANVLNNTGKELDSSETVLYLAYGSNLCAATFQGVRGIRPISQLNVVVPELVMTFDLAGIPYVEPCFANTRYRTPIPPEGQSEKSPLLPTYAKAKDYHKTRWKKGLVGVVYEITKADFAHVIATEGGGASYHDVLVDCYEIPPNTYNVPEVPDSEPFKAHTLYSPSYAPGQPPPKKGGRFTRPDPDYAQASARYLKLINDGAVEHALPEEYMAYLRELRPYTITTNRQKIGAFIFTMIWFPIIKFVFGLEHKFGDKEGRSPRWLVELTGAMFRGVWISYDWLFRPLYGDGERTIEGGKEDGGYWKA